METELSVGVSVPERRGSADNKRKLVYVSRGFIIQHRSKNGKVWWWKLQLGRESVLPDMVS